MNQPEPLISIVIPHFNREKVIAIAIEGILMQTDTNWECIIVDDGSSEESLKNLGALLDKVNIPAVRLYQRTSDRKKGANACRNMGVELAKGEYIAFLDSDDSWPPNYLRDCIQFAEAAPVEFTGSYSGAVVTRDGKETTKQSRPIFEGEGLFDFLVSPDVIAQTSSYFVRKHLAIQIPFDENLRRHQDYDFFIRFGKKFGWYYNPIAKTTIDWSTITSRVTDFTSCITVYDRFKSEFKNQNLRHGYLISLLGLAYKEKAEKNILDFYRDELKIVGFKRSPGILLMVYFPPLFRIYKKFF